MAALGSYLSSLPGGLQQGQANAVGTSSQSVEDDAAPSHDVTHATTLGSDSQTSDAGARTKVAQQRGVREHASIEGSSRAPAGEVHTSGWQLRLQSAVPQQQLQQVCAHQPV